MQPFEHSRTSQRGAVLIVSLLLLIVMTLLALGASRATNMQERMAGNQRDTELALQSAEASLRAAEELLAPTHALVTCVAPAADCEAYERDTLPTDLHDKPDTWWNTWGRDYDQSMGDIATTPEFVVEHVAESPDSLSVGSSYINVVRDFHRATARSTGMSDTSRVVLQSTFARISFE